MSKMMLVTTDSIGSSNHALGTVLMTSFFMNLAESEDLPSSIHFLNEGARLTCEGSRVLDFIKRLEGRGVTIATCQTCLEYLHLEDKLSVGQVGKMNTTVSDLVGTDSSIIIA
ncbi:MAG: hypothetical protein FWD41_00215 [Actinomycetia bacterium]|nr:hypothetical protein [Actinomycetes bacterium]